MSTKYAKYHLVTSHHETGEDDKDYVNVWNEVRKKAALYLKEGYETVYVFNEYTNTLFRVFDERAKRGRKPYPSEIASFHY